MKSNLHRRAHASGWGQANLRGIYPSYKARYKSASNHRIRIADCMLAVDELNPIVPTEPKVSERQRQWEMECDEQDRDIEQQRYEAWASGQEYPSENVGRYYDAYADYHNSAYRDSFDPSYFDHMQSMQNDHWVNDISHVLTVGKYEVRQWNAGIYHVEHGALVSNFIGSIRLNDDDLTWHVDYVPQRGEQTHYEFGYLDTSVEAATQLLILLHKMEIDDEPF